MREKPTLAFVDHSFHRKTQSGDFLRELLEDYFSVTTYFDASWEGGQGVSVEEINRHEYVLFEQTFCPLKDLRNIRAKIMWAPMYDGYDTSWSFWRYISGFPIKIISFSQKIHERAARFGIPSHYAQLYLNPDKYQTKLPEKGRHVFFWYRGPIRFQDLKTFLNPTLIDSFLYRSNPDPSFGRENISAEDQKLYKMNIVENDYIPKEEYVRLVSQSNMYIAPRKKEGIGLSFIEALAMGHVVIGHNDATMNEYIEHGKDGYLIDLKNPRKLDFSHFDEVRASSQKRAVLGYTQWEEKKKSIVDFINSPVAVGKNSDHKFALLLHSFESKIPTLKRTVARYKTKIKRMIDSHS